jgi:hypothetical protein
MITIYTLFQSFWIICGLWVVSRLFKMCVYEMLEKGAGEKYMKGELDKKWQDYLLKK